MPLVNLLFGSFLIQNLKAFKNIFMKLGISIIHRPMMWREDKSPMGHNAHLSQLLQVNKVIYSSFPISLSSFKTMASSFLRYLADKVKMLNFSNGHT